MATALSAHVLRDFHNGRSRLSGGVAGGMTEMQTATRGSGCVRSEGLTPSMPLELAVRSSSIFPQSRVENVLEHFLGAHVVESLIEHQTPDDPTADAECVKPVSCVVIESLCVRE